MQLAWNKQSLEGQQFGRLTVLYDSGKRYSSGGVIWTCRCECGEIVAVGGSNLTSGNTRSCGCLQVDQSIRSNSKKRRRLERCPTLDSAAIAAARHAAGASLLAVASALKISPSLVHYYETGRTAHAHPDVIRRLAELLGCEYDDLIQ